MPPDLRDAASPDQVTADQIAGRKMSQESCPEPDRDPCQRILYAPGRGRDLSVLAGFRKELAACGHDLAIVPFAYDTGNFAPELLAETLPGGCPWWTGISLGAALLWTLAAEKGSGPGCPRRLTLINPFADRERLSRERGFSLEGQWRFRPLDSAPAPEILEVVIALGDQAISPVHGLELLAASRARIRRLITVQADHQISDLRVQRSLARMLSSPGGAGYADAEHCDLYSWQGGVQ